jgi:hypothetical protein
VLARVLPVLVHQLALSFHATRLSSMLLVEDTTHDPDYSPPKKLTTQICLGDEITTFCKKQGLPQLSKFTLGTHALNGQGKV